MIELESLHVKIGDRIIGKKLGNLTPSTVVAILTQDFYFNAVLKVNTEYTVPKWDEFYPDWKDKLLVVGRFDEPQCPFSYQEICDRIHNNPNSFLNYLKTKVELPKNIEEAILKTEYAGADKSYTNVYPIDDVEVI